MKSNADMHAIGEIAEVDLLPFRTLHHFAHVFHRKHHCVEEMAVNRRDASCTTGIRQSTGIGVNAFGYRTQPLRAMIDSVHTRHDGE